jgi:hypothetical protein
MDWTAVGSMIVMGEASAERATAWTGQRSSSMRSLKWNGWSTLTRMSTWSEVEMNDDDMDFEVEMDEDVDMEYCVIETGL